MMGRLLLLRLLLLLAAAFAMSRGVSAFGVERVAITAEYCLFHTRYGAPFHLGTAAAIHLGNTNSCIAGYDFHPGSGYYQFCILSWVAVTDNGTLAGEAAMNHAALSPGTAISGLLRILRRRLDDPVVEREMELVPYKLTTMAGRVAIQVETGQDGRAKEFSPTHLTGILISELKRMAEAHLGREISYAVVTVPIYLPYISRVDGVVDAGEYYAGFRSVKVIDQQIAAAAAYGHHEKQGNGKAILVFRLGGRTTDATIFKFINGTADRAGYVAAHADLFLGGDDFTTRIVDYLGELIERQHGWDIRQDRAALRRLRLASEHAKKALSDHEETLVQVPGLLVGGGNFSAPLSRAKFEELSQDLLDRAMGLVDQVVMRLKAPLPESRKDMVDEIVLVGGGSRIPKVRQLVTEYFHGREPNSRKGVEPEEAVVRGTALLSRPEAARFVEECFDHWYPPEYRSKLPYNFL